MTDKPDQGALAINLDGQKNPPAKNTTPVTSAETPPPPLKDTEGELLPGQSRIDPETLKVIEGPGLTPDQLRKLAYEEEFKNFGYRIDPKTQERVYYEPAFDFASTAHRVREAFGEPRPDKKPDPIMPWEMRIGGARFIVPPININVFQTFKAGSMSAGAIRQSSTPKFNSGYSETTIELTLYFPNHESIWGFAGHSTQMDFETDGYEVVDEMLSSLRGLITQFRYAPFLPVRNQYLNQVYGITGVALQSMSIATVPGYPFCVAVNLSMLRFNHRVYLPMIEHFDQAMHWGKFRQYMGRAMSRMNDAATRSFLTQSDIPVDENNQPIGKVDMSLVTATEALNELQVEEIPQVHVFDKMLDLADGRWFELYYPYTDPASIDLPKEHQFRENPETKDTVYNKQNWWQELLKLVGGPELTTNPMVQETAARAAAEELGKINNLTDEARFLVDYLQTTGTIVSEMSMENFDEWAATRVAANPQIANGSAGGKDEYTARLRQVWIGTMYNMFLQDPSIARILAFQDLKRKGLFIQEWEVPMVKVGLAEPGIRDAIQVQAVSVSMGNNIARLQVQLHQEPVHQHIGGLDTTISIAMIVTGEAPLTMLRKTFDNLSGLARLEHQHGVLGFMGIKNVLTALCGMRYCLPQSFEVETIPNFPHCYNVRLTFTDFDIFQQKREMLSNTQQAEVVNAFKTKKNPFLRVKQLWGAFNAYPDFPLSVRDDAGDVVGNLDPDFYFKSFETFEPDLTEFGGNPQLTEADVAERQARNAAGLDFIEEDGIHHCFGKVDDKHGEWVSITKNGLSFRSGAKMIVQDAQLNEPHAGNMCVEPYVKGAGGAKGLAPASVHGHPYLDKSGSPKNQFEMVMKDLRYRDKGGRMVRAFPTYMLWIIDENGVWGGTKLFDNFYGLQSVIDFSVHESEDILGDTLVLRVSNIYSRLSTPFGDLLDEKYSATARMINTALTRQRRMATGFGDYLVRLDSIEMRPGVRVHLRMGYSSNPNNLDIVFNGVITGVEMGEIMTITAQSDAIELGAVVNPTNKEGHTGKIDGDLVGFYLSEPRDLMIRLLTMGSGTFREMFAHATQGKVFSENRFGIRHFGSILYQPMNDEERTGLQQRKGRMNQFILSNPKKQADEGSGGIIGLISPTVGRIVDDLWVNMSLKRDYELFKRNIYPGNGSGIAQYLGGDLGEGALNAAMLPTGVDEAGGMTDPMTGAPLAIEVDPIRILQQAGAFADEAEAGNENTDTTGDRVRADTGITQGHEFLKHLGITSRGDDDLEGMDEVAFRAQTYMKTVWDLFQICAALLPNYIVAVRPFEDRSTIFYGKPHWTYTSGLIPISLGVGIGQGGKNNEPLHELPDEELRNLYDRLSQEMGKDRQLSDFYQALTTVKTVDPTATTTGMAWTGAEPQSLPSKHPATGAKLKHSRGKVQTMMHLPVVDDANRHLQIEGLNPRFSHPFYMDRTEPEEEKEDKPTSLGGWLDDVVRQPDEGRNEYSADGTIMKGDKQEWPGRPGHFGLLPPDVEQYYCCQNWDSDDVTMPTPKIDPMHTRIMIYNPRTQKACICAPGDRGPSDGAETGCSPDVMQILAAYGGMDECFFGFVDDDHALGPVVIGSADANATEVMDKPAGAESTQAGKDPAVDPKVQDAINESNRAIAELDLGWLKEKGTDPGKYAFEFGWNNADVPVNFGNQNTQDGETGLYDEAGSKAYLLYENQRTQDEAEKIWDEFRNDFPKEDTVKNIFFDAYPHLKAPAEKTAADAAVDDAKALAKGAGDVVSGAVKFVIGSDDVLSNARQVVSGVTQLAGGFSGQTDLLAEEAAADNQARVFSGEEAYTQVLEQFQKFMWQNPYHRGWVVLTADTQFHVISGLAYDILGTGVLGDTVGGVIEGVSGWFGLDKASAREWNFHQAHKAWTVFIVEGAQACATWMQQNADAGKDQRGLLLRVGEESWKKFGEPIKDAIEQVLEVAGNVITGVTAFIRLAMLQLSQGMSLQADMQKRTNMLNRIFNDSLYYRAGADNSLTRLVDNPFTREYGEPVVEIRQPFQRVHFLSSFQHICKNAIIENTEEVSTVVTAVSNGNHPVTVWFDKGSAPELQKEKVVETGLYYDTPQGLPLLRSIPVIGTMTKSLGDIIHPVHAARNMIKETRGSGDELSAKRVALYHLRESLKNIYTGEIIVLGDASIRPHDLCYLGDMYERMFGFFEVEAVTHHFTPETGFISSIVPNALVTVNDPGRWSYVSYMNSRMAIKAVRQRLRESLKVRADNQGQVMGQPSYTVDQLVKMSSDQVLDATQYSGGMTGLVKDFTSLAGIGAMLVPGLQSTGPPANKLGKVQVGLTALVTGSTRAFDGWGIWKWVKEKLIDQHGCYIQYLTHKGQPMDGGLSPNSSVAVGQHHGLTFTIAGLRIPLSAKGDVTKQSMIHTNELLSYIGYSGRQTEELGDHLDMFTNDMYISLEKLAQRGVSYIPFDAHEVYWVTVTKVRDGDTFEVSGLEAAGYDKAVRMLIVDTAEDYFSDKVKGEETALSTLHWDDDGVRASRYTRDRLLGKEVALRILKTTPKDRYGRTLGFIFHNGPNGATPDERKEFILRAARSEIDFDAYTEDGDPYTFNWELLAAGLAKVEVTHYKRTLPGVIRGG